MKKTKLQVEYDFDFIFVGLVSSSKEYTLAWHLNKTLQVNLIKQEDVVISMSNQNHLRISNLLFETENSALRLLGNRSIGGNQDAKSLLLPELPNFTHFITMKDESETVNDQQLLNKIRQIIVVDYAALIDALKLKNKDNLIF